MEQEQDLEAIDRIYQALDDDDPERALTIALDQISRTGDDDPVLQFFAGKAWVEIGEAGRGISFLEKAVKLDPDDMEFRGELGFALLEDGRPAEAADQARCLMETAPDHPDGYYLDGMLHEVRGELADADSRYEKACQRDPDRYPAIRRLTTEQFAEQAEAAAAGLPERFREHLDRVATTVEPVVPDMLMNEGISPLDTLGLFTGTPLDQQGQSGSAVDLPPRILLFQRNLERFSSLEGDLSHQITVTLFHELGHYLGMDEADLDDAGFR
jgi:predicted Zn-dependent protease with MMP-like domain